MAQTSEKMSDKSYLASAVDSINPWASRGANSGQPKRSATPTPAPTPEPTSSHPIDHITNPLYGISRKSYPEDCPPLNVMWFHAVDVAKRKPKYLAASMSKAAKDKESNKPPSQPKKFATFQPGDSRAVEAGYQRLLEAKEERNANLPPGKKAGRPTSSHGDTGKSDQSGAFGEDDMSPSAQVPVNEDFLFSVDVIQRELAPVYWHGPVYEVRRGTWFYQEGSSLRPCEENLAAQLEDGYLKTRPWLIPTGLASSGTVDSRSRSASATTTKSSKEDLEKEPSVPSAMGKSTRPATPPPQPPSYRMFGSYMNSVATYQDANTAWLSSDGILSWVTSSVYQRFSGGGYMSGVKLVRGYSEPGKSKDAKRPNTPTERSADTLNLDEKALKALKRKSAPPSTKAEPRSQPDGKGTQAEFGGGPKTFEEEIRRREETEISDDYNAGSEENQGREIEHLVLVTHGIGQLLSLRLDSMNFIHDVNVMRKTMKSVYDSSADLKALNDDVASQTGNCRVQVLPVCWRHHLDFPKKRESKGERDLGVTAEDEDAYPSLEDITIEGVAFARSLISDLALDVLLYQSGYREQIMNIVLKEANRIYNLFKKQNPEFKGKVHLVGHSLGSAILFDLLCRQKEKPRETPKKSSRLWPSSTEQPPARDPGELAFDFDVEDFYCLGSPIGLFQMLKGRTVSARHLPDSMPSMSPLDPDSVEDPFRNFTDGFHDQRISPATGLPYSISSPRVSQLFNIFHPSDPISYRLEPLISPLMSTLKPQNLPYTKKGIFGSVAPQGLSNIGAMVGQSVSGLWSSLSAGVASNLLNRSLGLTNEEVARLAAASSSSEPGQESAERKLAKDASILGERASQLKKELGDKSNPPARTSLSGNDMTLIDYDLETLFSKFEKGRAKADADKSHSKSDMADSEAAGSAGTGEQDTVARKMRLEEAKVRALNRNGRVDYGIQESVLDYNPINTIASHMSYWADEDVNHFILSQLLANKSKGQSK
ncbi:related to phosphatidic acid-preferring phospholipase A1, contains DDHD domain [Cephalotrichum gorgonifer]|uniref:Related to phosphatidic acid-preferring phospholipase A1, contains DDHD domain n=1 Tax=Cephalotrichum gorgonifer TaxID=2041049 RepID=A0AAE8N896_9PEZI|nr:related to phosphatidic acid-preferring phospholipase A1, contains DDHD domain [Cephalotrichum gorgonifer]